MDYEEFQLQRTRNYQVARESNASKACIKLWNQEHNYIAETLALFLEQWIQSIQSLHQVIKPRVDLDRNPVASSEQEGRWELTRSWHWGLYGSLEISYHKRDDSDWLHLQ